MFVAWNSVFDAFLGDPEVRLRLWQVRRVDDFRNTQSLTGLFQHNTVCGRVSHDVPAGRTHWIAEEGLWVSLNLVCNNDREIQGLGYPEEFVQVTVQSLLSFAEGFSADVFSAEV